MKTLFLSTLVFVAVVSVGFAQDEASTCPMLVMSALDKAGVSCEDLNSGTVCYGNFDLDAEPQPTADIIGLNEPGDRESLARILSLRLSAMDETEETWGIALMDVRATREDSATTQDIRIVMFGDVSITNDVSVQTVFVNANANLRSQPSTNATIVGTITVNQELIADGRTSDGEWLRIRLPNNPNANAWISTTLVNSTTDLNQLDQINVDDMSVYNAMQAFYFESDKDDALCDEAPDSGLLLQTPDGIAEFTMLVNEVNIQLESTAFLQAVNGDSMTVFAINGDVSVEADGVNRVVAPGTKVDVPLDENGIPNAEPTAPEPYTTDSVDNLPTSLLADQISITPPLEVGLNEPIAGNWTFSWGIETAQCPGGKTIAFATEVPITSLNYAEDGTSLLILLSRYRRISQGLYESVFTDATGNLHRHTLTILSSDRISGVAEITYLNNDCILEIPFRMILVSTT